jgi:inosose dehydratase
MTNNRRTFLQTMASLSASTLLVSAKSSAAPYPYPISCNSYNWSTFYGRQNKDWGEDMDACLAELAKTGITAYEPGLTDVAEVRALAPLLKKHKLTMPSVYVNSVLHDAAQAPKSIASVLAIADEVKKIGTKIMVTNPSPIKWGGPEIKSDAELIEQAKNMDKLGAALRQKGIILAYHTHDVELRAGAREFHHVMLNTSPQNVSFCFDVHWVYRGSQNSQVAVFDTLKLYAKRIVELHIRQSVNHVWSETFGPGDIDYPRLVQELKKNGLRPMLVIEQCVEGQTPNTMNAVEAHIKDLAAIKAIFGPLM